jgi:hypothetical protein
MRKRICAYYNYKGDVFIDEEVIPELKKGEIIELGKDCENFKIGQKVACM